VDQIISIQVLFVVHKELKRLRVNLVGFEFGTDGSKVLGLDALQKGES
jgi:hypothetical protein